MWAPAHNKNPSQRPNGPGSCGPFSTPRPCTDCVRRGNVMGVPTTFGFPLMHLERGERRAFLPSLISDLDEAGAQIIVIEEGYGEGVAVPLERFLDASPKVKIGTYEDCLAQDVIVQVRCPPEPTLRRIRPNQILVAMLHYPTRPGRVAMLSQLGIHAVSLDSIVDDVGHRLVENMHGVAWYGMRAAFAELRKLHPRFESPTRGPLRVTSNSKLSLFSTPTTPSEPCTISTSRSTRLRRSRRPPRFTTP